MENKNKVGFNGSAICEAAQRFAEGQGACDDA